MHYFYEANGSLCIHFSQEKYSFTSISEFFLKERNSYTFSGVSWMDRDNSESLGFLSKVWSLGSFVAMYFFFKFKMDTSLLGGFFNDKVTTVLPHCRAIFVSFWIWIRFLKRTSVPNLELLSKIVKCRSWYLIKACTLDTEMSRSLKSQSRPRP